MSNLSAESKSVLVRELKNIDGSISGIDAKIKDLERTISEIDLLLNPLDDRKNKIINAILDLKNQQKNLGDKKKIIEGDLQNGISPKG